ncbi:MAG: protein-export chaperone SecB [Cetobacterium sp.]
MKKSNFNLLKQPLIKKMDFLSNTEFDQNTSKANINIDIKITNELSTTQNKAQVFLMIMLNTEKDIKDVPFILKSEILGQFSWEENATEEEISDFLNSVAPSILLSYMRPIISNIITYSGLPPYIIPFLDLRVN